MKTKFNGILTLLLALLVQFTFAQEKTISGTVSDESGPLPGVNVIVKGTTNGTQTDFDGNYTIKANTGDVLVFSYVGMNTTEKTIGTSNKINVVMTGSNVLEEVVVIGYGISVSDNEKTGAWSKVDSKELEQAPYGSIDQAIQGKVAGLVFSSAGGNPTAANTVVIRGPGTISGSMNPLYVIDGVPVGNGENVANVASSFNPLSFLNSNDIESVTVLKDAASTSIYGSRGANGVIVVTTKSGKGTEGTRFSFKTEVSFSDVAYNKLEYLNAQEYSDWGDLALTNAGINLGIGWGEYLGWDGVTDTDWLDAITRSNATQYSHSFSALGSSEKTDYRVSLGYTSNEPLAVYTDYNKYNLSLNVTNRASEKLTLNAVQNVAYQITNGNTVSGSFSAPFFAGSLGLPIDKAYNEDGSINVTEMSGYYGGWGSPIGQLKDNLNLTRVFTLNGNLGANYEFARNLSFDSKFSYNYQNYDEQLYWNPNYGDGEDYGGYGYSSKASYFQLNATNFLHYKNVFNDKHTLNVDLGIDYQNTFRHNSTFEGQGYSIDNPDLVYAAEALDVYENHEDWALWGAILRASYNFDSKYFVWGSLRRDYATIFAPEYREGYFWSGGLSWNAHKETFVSDINQISNLVLRGNYGTSGDTPNTSLNSTQDYKPLIGSSVYGSESSFIINSPGNSELTWQTSKILNLGLDLGLFNDRISFSIDRYIKTTSDLILNAPINFSNGGPNTIDTNIGEIENRGWEFSLTTKPIQTDDFSWDINLNAAYNVSEVNELVTDELIETGGYKALIVGEEVGAFYLRGYAGVDSETGSALFYADETETNTVNSTGDAEQYVAGKAYPTWSGSFSSGLNYKGFQLTGLFNFATDFQVYDVYNFINQSDGEYLYANQLKEALYDSWTTENTDAKLPQQLYGGNGTSNNSSSRFLYDGDYIRLKEIKLAYTLDKKVLDQIGFIDNITLYARGTNLWTHVFDDDLKFDPESNSLDNYTNFQGKSLYDNVSPVLKSYSLGLTVEF